MGNFIDLTGQRFGMWTVLSRAANNAQNKAMWNVRCDCGKEKTVSAASLRRGLSKSCGCLYEREDLTGKKFGEWTVISYAGNNRWNVKCTCGTQKTVLGAELKRGDSKSCGCWGYKRVGDAARTHGKTHSRLYRVWCNIKGRCYKPSEASYPNYGGRGIIVCEEWKNDFQAFYDWAMANGYDENAPRFQCTIDRIDNNGNYCPENCRWVDRYVQANNVKKNVFITYNGERLTIAQFARKYNLSVNLVRQRFNRGMSAAEIIDTPIRGR